MPPQAEGQRMGNLAIHTATKTITHTRAGPSVIAAVPTRPPGSAGRTRSVMVPGITVRTRAHLRGLKTPCRPDPGLAHITIPAMKVA